MKNLEDLEKAIDKGEVDIYFDYYNYSNENYLPTVSTFIEDYVTIMLKEAKTNPNGPIGSLIARQLLQEDIIASLDSEADKYLARDIDFNEYRLLKTLYKEQQQVYTDPAGKIIVIGSRRIGKTELSARLLIKDILKPNHHGLYIHTNFENAINQLKIS